MKVNFDVKLYGLDGKTAIKAGSAVDAPEVTLGMICAMALLNDNQDPLDKKLKTFKLLKTIVDSEGKNESIDVSDEQVALIKEKVGAPGFQGVVVVGRVIEALTE